MLDYENILDTYSLDYIIEYNELTEAEVLKYLVETSFIQIPDPRPVDCD
jgi:hypothetical protein